ncbi:MAG: hypothetical protein RBT75_02515 [Anaerolineae bacterium]|jgi:hypothetical protein|nr:hypothetical protein [Anaerolineae bacterium]
MKLTRRLCNQENDFWRIRNFLRDVFLHNGRLEHSWNVARFDYWRRHFRGCTRVFSTANENPADALYRSMMTAMKVTDTWIKTF